MSFETKISKIIPLTEKVITAFATDSIQSIIDSLNENKIGSVVIVNKELNPIGIITERDIITKVLTRNDSFEQLQAEGFMTSNPKCLYENDPISMAAQYMRVGSFRHLVIISEDNKVKAMLSNRDILNFMIDEWVSKN